MSASSTDLVGRLRAAGCVFAEREAALLRAEAVDADHLELLARQREAGRPLEQVVGWAEFCGLRISVAPGVFVPRRRTTLLVRQATAMLDPGATLVDVGCGTGAIAAAVAAAVPGVEVYAVDVDPDAVACARTNLFADRVLLGDLFEPLPPRLRGRVDLVVANAPYVPTDHIALMPPEARDHEHRVALDGGPEGLAVQRRVIAESPGWLRGGGRLLVETGQPQVEATCTAFREAGFDVEVVTDEEIGGTAVVGLLEA